MLLLKTIFIQYLLLPLIALVLTGLMVLVKKKNKIVQNKKLVIYLLVAALVLALPGIGGLAGNTFSPYWYLFVQIIYLGLGIWHTTLLQYYFRRTAVNTTETAYAILFEMLLTLIAMTLGGYLFTLLFNWLSPFKGYGFTAATSMTVFIVPLVFQYTYQRFVAIPFAIYKVWQFEPDSSYGDIDPEDTGGLLLINLELTRNTSDGNRIALKAKSPQKMVLGRWMNRVLDDHNLKNPGNQIQTYSSEGDAYGWIFYVKPSFFRLRRYLDHEKTVAANGIREKDIVVCKRVIRGEEEIIAAVAAAN